MSVAALCAVACISLPNFAAPGDLTGGGIHTSLPDPYDANRPTPGPSASPSPSPSSSNIATGGTNAQHVSYLHQSGGNIYNAKNEQVVLRGIGWYGFESRGMLNFAPTYNRLGSDVVTVMQRMYLMGFNTVNIGFSFSQLYDANSTPVISNGAPVVVPCSGTSDANSIIASVTVPGFGPAPNTPLLSNVPAASDGMCNDYLPDVTQPVIARLAAVVDLFTRNGMYVLLTENLDRDAALSYDPAAFSNQWKLFAQDLIRYGGAYQGMAQPSCSVSPNDTSLGLCHNVVLGVMSNVSSLNPNLSWEPNNGYRTIGAHQLAVAAFTALDPVMPRAMFLLGGALQFGLSTTLNSGMDPRTGGSFPALAGPASVASSNGFFADVLNGPWESRLMFGFNAWGPSTDLYLGNFTSMMSAKIAADLDYSYGILSTGHLADGSGTAHLFPSMPIAFGADPSDPNDNIFLAAMQGYMTGHNMPNFIWWCFNGATSTHSALTDATYYTTLNPMIVAYLQGLGLTPP